MRERFFGRDVFFLENPKDIVSDGGLCHMCRFAVVVGFVLDKRNPVPEKAMLGVVLLGLVAFAQEYIKF